MQVGLPVLGLLLALLVHPDVGSCGLASGPMHRRWLMCLSGTATASQAAWSMRSQADCCSRLVGRRPV